SHGSRTELVATTANPSIRSSNPGSFGQDSFGFFNSTSSSSDFALTYPSLPPPPQHPPPPPTPWSWPYPTCSATTATAGGLFYNDTSYGCMPPCTAFHLHDRRRCRMAVDEGEESFFASESSRLTSALLLLADSASPLLSPSRSPTLLLPH